MCIQRNLASIRALPLINKYFFMVYTSIFLFLIKQIQNIFVSSLWQPNPVLLPGKSRGWVKLAGCSPWGHKELDTTEPLQFHFLYLIVFCVFFVFFFYFAFFHLTLQFGDLFITVHRYSLHSFLQLHSTLLSEKVMAPHSSTLAWKIPLTEEPGRLQSMGSRRVRHD